MIDVAYFTALILLFLRMTAFFIVVPIFFPKGTPNTMKVTFSLLISYMLIAGVPYSATEIPTTFFSLAMSCSSEIVMGITLGFVTNLCFNCIKMAGQLMDFAVGFSMISMFDPTTSSNSTLLEHVLYWFSLMVFFIIDGHHMLFKVIIESFQVVKLGTFFLSQGSILMVFKIFIDFFTIGLKIAIPILLIILITDITMGLVSRTVPQLNIMILGLPVKILVGLSALLFALPVMIKMMENSFAELPGILRSFFKVIPFIVIFASEDKTEDATPKKKSEARKKGQIPRSKEIGLALTLLATTIVLSTLGGFVGNNLKDTVAAFLGNYLTMELTTGSIKQLTILTLWRIAMVFLPIVIPIMFMGILASFAQTGFMLTGEPIQPKLSKINPLNGFKRMFSIRTLVELVKDIAIIGVVGYVGYGFVRDNYEYILSLGNLRVGSIPAAFGKLVVSIFFKITLIMIIIAIIDYVYQRLQYNKDLKMTKQEIKEEFKQQEGNPEIKGKIKQKQREMAMRRMMQQVPNATVVVTNPTHVAVALKYVEGESKAPILLAKGMDHVALKIKEIAKDKEIPIIENKALARLIYSEVELEGEIPTEMYQAVAEILALVYKLKKRK